MWSRHVLKRSPNEIQNTKSNRNGASFFAWVRQCSKNSLKATLYFLLKMNKPGKTIFFQLFCICVNHSPLLWGKQQPWKWSKLTIDKIDAEIRIQQTDKSWVRHASCYRYYKHMNVLRWAEHVTGSRGASVILLHSNNIHMFRNWEQNAI